MRKSVVIALQLDAFRHDYLQPDAMRLRQLADSGLYGRLVPTFGFEPDAAFLSGLYPDEADGGAQFWYDQKKSPFKFCRLIPSILDRLPRVPELVIRRGIRWIARKQSTSPMVSPVRIPFELLRYFDCPIQVPMDEPGFTPSPSIFDHLRRAKRPWLMHMSPRYRVTMEAVVARAETDLHSPVAFAFFHIGNLDRIGHKFGPESVERREEVKTVDDGINRLHEIATKRFDDVHWVIFGDHGMVEVSKLLDIPALIKKLPVKIERDYLMFLDSTIARFWFFNERARNEITNALTSVSGGHLLSHEERDRHHLNYRHNRFGDAIFIADPGILISPNFFQKKEPIKGMHGYLPETADQQSMFIVSSSKITRQAVLSAGQDMRRIFPTILELLEIPKPADLFLESLLTGELSSKK